MRNSLLRNNGDGTFTDVTRERSVERLVSHALGSMGGLRQRRPVDVFVGHEEAPSSLFHNMETEPSSTSQRRRA